MKIKKLPNVLALHLKRFKYQEDVQRFLKLAYRVVFPFELRLFNTVDDVPNADRMYRLWAIVVHIGAGLHHGHYVAIIKSGEKWLLFDDDTVSAIEESDIQKFYGDTPGYGSGYVLFYEAVDLDVETILPPTLQAKRKRTQSNDFRMMATKEPSSPVLPTARKNSSSQFSPPSSKHAASLVSPAPATERTDSGTTIPQLTPKHTSEGITPAGESPNPFHTPAIEKGNPFATPVSTPKNEIHSSGLGLSVSSQGAQPPLSSPRARDRSVERRQLAEQEGEQEVLREVVQPQRQSLQQPPQQSPPARMTVPPSSQQGIFPTAFAAPTPSPQSNARAATQQHYFTETLPTPKYIAPPIAAAPPLSAAPSVLPVRQHTEPLGKSSPPATLPSLPQTKSQRPVSNAAQSPSNLPLGQSSSVALPGSQQGAPAKEKEKSKWWKLGSKGKS